MEGPHDPRRDVRAGIGPRTDDPNLRRPGELCGEQGKDDSCEDKREASHRRESTRLGRDRKARLQAAAARSSATAGNKRAATEVMVEFPQPPSRTCPLPWPAPS